MQEQNITLLQVETTSKKPHLVCVHIHIYTKKEQKQNMGFLTRLKPGSLLPERTTTTGDSLPVKHIKTFHIIKTINLYEIKSSNLN